MTEPPTFKASRHSQKIVLADWRDAEELAAWHMSHVLHYPSVTLTRAGADGGIDVTSPNAVAQVKHHASPIGSPEVQQLRGAGHGHDQVLFYSLGGFTAAARQTADNLGVALYIYNIYGTVTEANQAALTLLLKQRPVAAAETPPLSERAWLGRFDRPFTQDEAAARREFAELQHLCRTNAEAAQMPPKRREGWELFDAARKPLRRAVNFAAGDIEFTLRAFDHHEGERWYQVAGGPPGLEELQHKFFVLGLVLEGIGVEFSDYDEEEEEMEPIETRADIIERVRMLEVRARDLLGTWVTIQAALPPDKLGHEDYGHDEELGI